MTEKKKISRNRKATHGRVALTVYLDEGTLDYIDEIKDGDRGASQAAAMLIDMGIEVFEEEMNATIRVVR